MDANTSISTSIVEGVDQNGVHDDNPCQGKESVATEQPDGIQDAVQVYCKHVSSGVVDGLKDGKLTDPSTQEVAEYANVHEESNNLPASGEVEVQQKHQENNVNGQTSQGKVKRGKPLSSRNTGGVGMKKTDSGKEVKTHANGTHSPSLGPKQPVLRSKSVNNGQIAAHKANKMMKPASATSNAHKPKIVKSNSPNATENNVQSDSPMEKTKLKPLRTGPQHKTEADIGSTLSPRSEDAKPCKVGKLPSYSFNFRCNERAEKRREFYSKLEEKIQAKEVEISNQEAKSKETQAAEIKMLRKSLNFKATPMPGFYQEPPPPKVELKKIPTTRARSPKLGRRKSSSTTGESDGSGRHNSQPGRLSSGAKVLQSKSSRGTSPIQPKKPLRKALPRLPSEKPTLPSKASDEATKEMSKKTLPQPQIERDTAPNSEPYQAPVVSGIESVDVVEQDSQDTPISSEPQSVAVEN